nr:purine-nucleoside phosphorylase [uncultured Faecalimonas sp.]
MNQVYEKLLNCSNAVRSKIKFQPEVALILGSGLGDYAKEMQVEETIEYSEIEGFPISTVAGHQGRFLFGYVKGVPVVAMQGRVHFYEGYPMSDVVLPVRLMGLLGAKTVILTNAAGGVNFNFQPGDLMMITDQITTAVPSPLIGANLDELGPRFPDMSEVYDKGLRQIIRQAARNVKVSIQSGVYMQFTGPSYETPAEIRMCRVLGADAAGMSTACEAMAARHMGLKVCGISCITNMAAGMSNQPLDHKEVQETADRVAKEFKALVTETIRLIGEQ